MIKHFKGFYSPTDNEYKELWDNCLFVFDTNILLNFLRYDQATTETLFDIFENISEQNRLWFPHQIALEYQFNLNDVISDQDDAYERLSKMIKTKINEIEKTIKDKYERHSNLKTKPLLEIINRFNEDSSKELDQQKKSHPNLNDISNRLFMLLDSRVGEPYSQEELDLIYKEGKERFAKKVPPGFEDLKDSKKVNGRKYHDGIQYEDLYGDLVFWKQIIDKSKIEEKPIILVTEDSKEDWWVKKNGQVKSPLPELIHEFNRFSNGMNLYMYRTEQFVKYAKDYFNIKGSDEQLDEILKDVENVRKHNEIAQHTSRLRKNYKFKGMNIQIQDEDLVIMEDDIVLEFKTGSTEKAVEFFESNKEQFGDIIAVKMWGNVELVDYHLYLINESNEVMHIAGGCTSGYAGKGSNGTFKLLKSAGIDVTKEFIYENPTFVLFK